MRFAVLVGVTALLAASGCTLPEAIYNLGGDRYYSAGGDDHLTRDQHFNAEMRRWKQREYEHR